ncbi:MAG: HEPN domain-containing protein [Dehalococcoidia bacterium]|nr:HEPN domain-containing protein [Dehalococcoidia bacterium]
MKTGMSGNADPRAVAVARAVYEAVRPESVILFGSRARGDYREDSDVDLMVICGERMSKHEYMKAQRAAGDAARDVYGMNYGVDLLPIRKSVYLRCRGGINHVAAQAARDGVDMNGEKEDYKPDIERRFDWEDVRQRVINTDREIITLKGLVEGDFPQEAIGFHAQQALENILKGWISALGISYGNTHDLEELLKIIKTIPEEMDTRAGEELKWLTAYAVEYRYWGAEIVLEDIEQLHRAIARTVEAIGERIKELTGVAELPRYTRPTRRLSDDDVE